MVAIFEFCHKTFYGKYEVGLDPKPMSTSEIVLFVTVAIFAKSSILDIGRDPRSVSDKALLKRPLMAYTTFSGNPVEQKGIIKTHF